jgi:hypothetical protein
MPATKILWIDGVGSFALCDSQEITIGQAFPGNSVDLAIRGDISRNAAVIQRVGEDHVLQPTQTVEFAGTPTDRPVLLADGMKFSLGRVELKYTRPSKLSATARLELMGNNRWQPLLTAAILLGESCILGAGSGCHIRCPEWSEQVMLFRNGEQWFCRIPVTANVKMNGEIIRAPVPLQVGQRIRGDEISMILE